MMQSEFVCGSLKFDVANYLIKSGEDSLKVLSKTGPSFLSHISSDENTYTLSIKACKKLLDKININLSSIQLLIVVTETPIKQFPGNSFSIASEIGLDPDIELIDLNAGCTGFVDALSLSMRLNKKTLIVCAETYSSHMGELNKSVKCLFSDAASATFLDPNNYRVIIDQTYFKKNSSNCISKKYNENMIMNGSEVFEFGLKEVSAKIINTIKEVNKPMLCFIHQGSKLIIETLEKKLNKFDLDIPKNISSRGNCISATIPILMCDSGVNDLRAINKPVLFVGFGVGLYIHLIVMDQHDY